MLLVVCADTVLGDTSTLFHFFKVQLCIHFDVRRATFDTGGLAPSFILKSYGRGCVIIDGFDLQDPTHFLIVTRFLHFI